MAKDTAPEVDEQPEEFRFIGGPLHNAHHFALSSQVPDRYPVTTYDESGDLVLEWYDRKGSTLTHDKGEVAPKRAPRPSRAKPKPEVEPTPDTESQADGAEPVVAEDAPEDTPV